MSRAVMIVDDSPLVCRQVERALCASGYTVIQAADGREALEKLLAWPEISLVMCDINMPRMDGLEFLAQVRATPASAVPVVMLTTERQAELVRRAKELGARGWITKPFTPDALVATARKLLGDC